MKAAIEVFEANIARVRELGGVSKALSAMTTPVIDVSDIIRAQLVLAVSAFDHYIHELTRLGMLEVFDQVRPAPPAYLKFRVPMDSISSNPGQSLRAAFESEIRLQHSYVAFQHPERIADAVRLFSTVQLWLSVASLDGMTAQETKERIQLIVDRRNKIAHEADIDPGAMGSRWPITAADVDESVDFIDHLCHRIHQAVA